ASVETALVAAVEVEACLGDLDEDSGAHGVLGKIVSSPRSSMGSSSWENPSLISASYSLRVQCRLRTRYVVIGAILATTSRARQCQRNGTRARASLLDAAQAAEAVVVVVAPRRGQLALGREHAVGAGVQADRRAAEHRLPAEADHARDRRRVGHGERDVLEEARAHDRIGLRQGVEHGARAIRRVLLAGARA